MNTSGGRAITFRKDSTGPTILRRGLTTTGGKRVNFTMSKHHESGTNGTGLENGEPGLLNHLDRSYGREDTREKEPGTDLQL